MAETLTNSEFVIIAFDLDERGNRVNIQIPGMHIDPVTDEWVFDD